MSKLAVWLNKWGYEESLVNEQIDRVGELDREALLANVNKEANSGRVDRIPLVLTYHPALNSVGKNVMEFHSVLSSSEEHRTVFPEPPVLHFDSVRTLRIYWLGLGLRIRITVMKGVVIVVKSPDVKCVYQ